MSDDPAPRPMANLINAANEGDISVDRMAVEVSRISLSL